MATGTKSGGSGLLSALGVIVILVGAIGFAMSRGGEDDDGCTQDECTVIFYGEWEPADNEVDFFWLVGVGGNTWRGAGPSHAEEVPAKPGDRLELLVANRQPMEHVYCHIIYGNVKTVGTITDNGDCHLVVSIPA